MIHDLLLYLDGHLPLYPPGVVMAAAALVVVLTLVLFGRSRQTILFSIAVAILGLGLAVGIFGVGHPPARPATWGEVEEVAESLVGPDAFRRYEQLTAAGLLLATGLLALVYNGATREKPGESARRLLAQDQAQRTAMGSAHLCRPQTFRRWAEHDPLGWTLQGRFWGANGQKLGRVFSLSGEDIARGVAVFGPQGSGKTQAVILPAIADRMRDGHSLIITDVQGELQPYVRRLAATTKHVVILHNPSEPEDSCAINLCDWIDDVADAQAMATVLLSGAHQQSQDPFWTKAATNLLAACSLHYASFGHILSARRDPYRMAQELKGSHRPAATDLAADFSSSMETKDPKLALNIMATAFNIGLAPWADPALRSITDHTDLDLASQLVSAPTVVLLSCARRHTDAYGAYLGTVLRVLTTRLDDLGQQAGGALRVPVGLILEEFPALGRLDSLVRDVNLVRKRRISILTAAQSLAQFDHIYPARGEADRLLAGLATKIVFGGCDQRTAEFFSELSGQQTLALTAISRSRGRNRVSDANLTSLRGRALLLSDDLVRPSRGHATVFAAYSAGNRAEQAIFHAELTPFFRRKDWRLAGIEPRAPITAPPPVKASTPAAAETPPDEAEPQAAEESGAPDREQAEAEQIANAMAQAVETGG